MKRIQLQREPGSVSGCVYVCCIFIYFFLYSYSTEENKSCMTNFYSTSGTLLPPLLFSFLVDFTHVGSRWKLRRTFGFCWKCNACPFEINSLPIFSYLLNGSYRRDFRTSLSWTANEFVVLIVMPGSPGWGNMKCQALINSEERLANIIDSFHYTKSTYNWPRGSLPLKLKVVVFQQW